MGEVLQVGGGLSELRIRRRQQLQNERFLLKNIKWPLFKAAGPCAKRTSWPQSDWAGK